MRKIAKKIYSKTSIEKNSDVKKIINFISAPTSVKRMIDATKAGKPAFSGIVREFEDKFAHCESFPLNPATPNSAKNRRNIGWIVKYVMAEYGYTPISSHERTRIGSGSRYFTSAAVYEKTCFVPRHEVFSLSAEVDRELTRDELWICEDSDDYNKIKESIRELRAEETQMNLSYEFICEYLNRSGYHMLLNIDDIQCIFNGTKIPCVELYEAISEMFSFFRNFMKKSQTNYHEILGSSTWRALNEFYACKINPDDVTDVFIYLDEWDSIIDGRYNSIQNSDNTTDEIICLDAPTFIIKTKKQEYWFNGLTCGYGGTGCGGSEEVLLNLGIIEKDGHPTKYEIATNRCLHYFRKGDNWVYHGEKSMYDIHYKPLRDKAEFFLFMYNGHLTISHLYKYPHRYDLSLEKTEPDYEWFIASNYFIPNPIEVELIEVKIDHTILSASNHDPSYQVIIRDKSGRELWLDYPFNDIHAEKRENLYKFFDSLGFSIPREKSNSALFKPTKSIYGTYRRDDI